MIAWRVTLLALSGIAVVAGIAMIYVPAGVIASGLGGFAALYALSYLEGRR